MLLSNGPQYLGRVRRAPHRGDAYHYATIEPLIESNASGTQWVGPVQRQFPTRGLVHWHDAPLGLQLASVWQFGVDDHPLAERGDRAEQLQVANYPDPIEPIEVIDLRGWADEMALRSAITSDGIAFVPAPLCRRLLLRLASGVCAGPLLVKPAVDGGRWILDAPESHRDAARMPVWRLAPTEIDRVALDGGRWFVSPQLDLGSNAGIQNWSTDSQVARSVISRLRKMDAQVLKAVSVTDSIFRAYLERVESSQLTTDDPSVERARSDRLRGMRQAIQSNVALLQETADTLLQSEPVRSELDLKVEAEYRRLLAERRDEATAALESLNTQLSQVSIQLADNRTKLEELEESVQTKQLELNARVESFDRELTGKLAEMARRPEAVFAQAAIIRAALAPNAPPYGVAFSGSPSAGSDDRPSAAVNGPADERVNRLAVPETLRAGLGACAIAEGLSPRTMWGLHASFVVGNVPIVAGARGYDLLLAYASVVASGRLLWVPIGSSMLEPQDLIGRFDFATGRIVPHPAGVLDVVSDATRTGRIHVVVLEGFNRAPLEAYLSPIAEAAAGGRRGDRVRAIPLASRLLLSREDPYRELNPLVWPPNVLLACLPTEGSATLPVPSQAWRYLSLLEADDRDWAGLGEPTAGPRDSIGVTEIDPAFWRECIAAGEVPGKNAAQDLGELARALSLAPPDAEAAFRVRRVLLESGFPAADATAIAITTTLVPRSPATAKILEDAIRSTGIAIPGWQASHYESQRLRG